MVITTEERRRILQARIQDAIARGYRVVSQTDTTAQLVKGKKFSVWMFLLFFGIFYLPYYWAKRERTLYVSVDEWGAVMETPGK